MEVIRQSFKDLLLKVKNKPNLSIIFEERSRVEALERYGLVRLIDSFDIHGNSEIYLTDEGKEFLASNPFLNSTELSYLIERLDYFHTKVNDELIYKKFLLFDDLTEFLSKVNEEVIYKHKFHF